MASKKPRKSESVSRRQSLSEYASDRIGLYVKHFEINLSDASRDLPPDGSESEYLLAATKAMFQTFLDSGLDIESISEAIGKVLIEERRGLIEWSSALNQRRFELIDKQIQDTLVRRRRGELPTMY